MPMDSDELIKRLTYIANFKSGCLCGHCEWCENCSPSSGKREVQQLLRDLVRELRTGQSKEAIAYSVTMKIPRSNLVGP